MKDIHNNWRSLIKDLLTIVCIFGTVSIALKFLYFQLSLNLNLKAGNIITEIYFPFFPNVLDSAFLIFATLFLAAKSLKRQ